MIRDILRDPAFWTFCTALVVTVRWLARVFYLYKQKNIIKQGQIESQIAAMKEDLAIKLTMQLKEVADNVNATLDRHEAAIKKFDVHVQNMAIVYSNMTDMMTSLQNNFSAFEVRMKSVSQGASLVMDRIKLIETEIEELKSGNIFVRTKK